MTPLKLFDTFSFGKKLANAKFTPEQTEAILEVVREARDYYLEMLCTKQDLSEVESHVELKLKENSDRIELELEKIRKDITEIRKEIAEIRKEIAEIKRDLALEIEQVRGDIKTKLAAWIMGVASAQTVVTVSLILTVIKFLVH